MRQVAAGLGVSAFGISIVELDPAPTNTPSTTTPRTGSAARCSPSAPSSSARRRSTSPCAAPGTLEADGERYQLDPDHIVRVGPAVKRKVIAGPDGLAGPRCHPSGWGRRGP